MSATEWIAQRRELLAELLKPVMPLASVGLSILARSDLPRALGALEAVLAIIGRQEYRTPGAPETYDQWHEGRSGLADEIEQAIEAALRGDS